MLVATRRKCWVSPSWYNMTLVIPQSLAPPHQFTPLLNSFSGLAGGQVTSPLPTWNTEISKHWDVPVVDFVVCVCVCVLEVYSGTDPKLQSNNLIFQDNLPDLIWAHVHQGSSRFLVLLYDFMSSFVSSWHRQEEQVLLAHFILFITERRVFELPFYDYHFGQRQPL